MFYRWMLGVQQHNFFLQISFLFPSFFHILFNQDLRHREVARLLRLLAPSSSSSSSHTLPLPTTSHFTSCIYLTLNHVESSGIFESRVVYVSDI